MDSGVGAKQGQESAIGGSGGRAVHATVRRAFEALDHSRTRWALLRGESELGSPGGDVDILAAPSDLPRIEHALAPLGFARLRSYGRGSHSFFVTYDEGESCWVKLDVVTELAFGRFQELPLEGVAGCLERRRRAGALVVLGADDAFWALLLHCLLDRGAISEVRRQTLLELSAGASAAVPLALALERTLSGDWRADALLARAQAGEWDTLERLAPAIRAAWVRGRPVGVRMRRLRNAALRRAGRVPPLCRRGPILRTRPLDSGFAAALAGHWFFPDRFMRLGESPVALARAVVVARWHAARGRLVVLEVPESLPGSRLLDRFSGAWDISDRAFARKPLPAATAAVWRRYMGRA